MRQLDSWTEEPIDWTGYRWPESDYVASQRYQAIYCPITKVACSSLKLWWAEIHHDATDNYLEPLPDTPPAIAHDRLDRRFKLQRLFKHYGEEILESDDWFRFAFVRNPWARTVSAFISKILSNQPQSDAVIEHFKGRWTRDDWQRVLKRSTSRWKLPFAPTAPIKNRLDEGNEPARLLMTFRDFVDYLGSLDLDEGSPEEVDIHWLPQYRFLGNVKFHFIGRFENMETDFQHIAERLGVEKQLSSFNRTHYSTKKRWMTNVADWPLYRLRDFGFPGYREFYTRDLIDKVGKIYRRDVEQFGYQF